MKSIALVSNTEIINKIFTLISKKLMVTLKIYKSINIHEKHFDMIVVDDSFLGENIIKLKTISHTLVLLKNDSLSEVGFDFIIEKPFLPSTLTESLENILKTIDNFPYVETPNSLQIEKEVEKTIYKSDEPSEKDITDDLAKFIDNMVNELDEEISYNSDDLTVKKEQLGHGGVLDRDELSKLYDMINDDEYDIKSSKKNDIESDWIELSDIIDKAINDISSYEFKEDKPIKLILNQYTINELAPLLKKLNQNVIDSLTQGSEITIQLRLEKNE